jgi:hypothetical protein
MGAWVDPTELRQKRRSAFLGAPAAMTSGSRGVACASVLYPGAAQDGRRCCRRRGGRRSGESNLFAVYGPERRAPYFIVHVCGN